MDEYQTEEEVVLKLFKLIFETKHRVFLIPDKCHLNSDVSTQFRLVSAP